MPAAGWFDGNMYIHSALKAGFGFCMDRLVGSDETGVGGGWL